MKRLSTFRPKAKFQIMMLGNAAVGKSSLLQRFISDASPTISQPMATIGAEFKVKRVCLVDGVVRLKIWDTSGQERFKDLLRTYYDRCNGAVIVYDIQNRESYEHAQAWVTELREKISRELVLVLAGNKADMDIIREVTKFEAEEYATHHNLIFLETSSVNGMNVNICFTEMAKALYAQRNQSQKGKKSSNLKETTLNEHDEKEEIKPSFFNCFGSHSNASKST
ncbi:ras-related protein Rab-5A-like [Drosophila montana]|uniref:ras-related protein Rab-5A-like n=1 Tax=Drosophila montana TaxID=40370 RepID=UPI00313E053F